MSLMVYDNRTADGKVDAHPLRLNGVEGFEKPVATPPWLTLNILASLSKIRRLDYTRKLAPVIGNMNNALGTKKSRSKDSG
jgi:hypothetical protein